MVDFHDLIQLTALRCNVQINNFNLRSVAESKHQFFRQGCNKTRRFTSTCGKEETTATTS